MSDNNKANEDDYFEYSAIKTFNRLSAQLDDIKNNDSEFYDELKSIFNTRSEDDDE